MADAVRFRIRGLDPAPFRRLFDLDAADLAAAGACRVVADEPDAYPCRVTLEDAAPGEALVLVNFEHFPDAGPYGSRGPIYVRQGGLDGAAAEAVGRVPAAIRRRLLSVRAYDRAGLMVAGEVVEGAALEPCLEECLADPAVDFVHLHFARRGCFAARVDRA